MLSVFVYAVILLSTLKLLYIKSIYIYIYIYIVNRFSFLSLYYNHDVNFLEYQHLVLYLFIHVILLFILYLSNFVYFLFMIKKKKNFVYLILTVNL